MNLQETVFMNKICVFAKNKSTYFIKRLMEEVGHIELFDPWFDQMLPEADIYLARTSGVYRNDLDLMMMGALPKNKVFNSVESLRRFRLKSTQYLWMEENDFPALPWVSLKEGNIETAEKFFRLYPECVVKPLAGQGGWGIEILTWDKYKGWKNKKKKVFDKDYLLQPLIKGADEYRYIFIKGSDPVILKRSATSGVAANFKAGGKAEVARLSDRYYGQMQKIILASGTHYGAIDFFVQDGEMSVIDFNSVPGLEQAESISGRNLVRDLVQSFK